MANMIASLKEGGALLLIEPDFLPVSVAEPQEVRAFWKAGLSGRVSEESITTLAGHLRLDWLRSA